MTTNNRNNPQSAGPSGDTQGIPWILLRRMCEILCKLEELRKPELLRTIFIDSRLCQWRDKIPESSTLKERVLLIVGWLYDKKNIRNENGLVLFFYVLRDFNIDVAYCYQELDALARELERRL